MLQHREKPPPKSNRRSRLKRIGFALVDGPDQLFEPTPSDWQRIETSLGVQFSDDHRQEIKAIIDEYYSAYRSERMAPSVKDTREWVLKLKHIGEEFLSNLRRDGQRTIGDGPSFAEIFIAQGLTVPGTRNHDAWGDFMLRVAIFNDACAKADKRILEFEIGESQGICEGRAWTAMVVRLTNFARNRRFPSGVSKAGINFDTSSPFTSFLASLQELFPADATRHSTNQVALAQGISSARKEAKKYNQPNAIKS